MRVSQQLIVDAKRAVRAVPNEERKDPSEFEDLRSGDIVPRIGSTTLLRLASFASSRGWEVVDVDLLDRSMSELSPDLEDSVSQRLVEDLRGHDVHAAADDLKGERGPYEVMAIILVGESDEDVKIGRLGVLESSSEDADDVVQELLMPAWSALKL